MTNKHILPKKAIPLLVYVIVGAVCSNISLASEIQGMAPENIVARFIKLDAIDIKRTGKVLEQLSELSARSVPEYDVHLSVDDQYIYKSYKITDTKIEGDSATVIVEYQMIGWILEYINYYPSTNIRNEKFRLVKKKGRWLIQDRPWIVHWKPVAAEIEKQLEKDRYSKHKWNNEELSESYRLAKKWRLLEQEKSVKEINRFATATNPTIAKETYTVEAIVMKLYSFPQIDLEKQKDDLMLYLMNRTYEELRLIRNSIFAGKNYKFKDKGLKGYYADLFKDYRPQHDNVRLSNIETKNINLLVNLEKMAKSKAAAN